MLLLAKLLFLIKIFVKLIIVSAVFCQICLSQNGPGGVGNTLGSSELVLWLNPDDLNQANNSTLQQWLDKSGYSNNALTESGNEPTVNQNSANGYDMVNFKQSKKQYFYVSDHASFLLACSGKSNERN